MVKNGSSNVDNSFNLYFKDVMKEFQHNCSYNSDNYVNLNEFYKKLYVFMYTAGAAISMNRSARFIYITTYITVWSRVARAVYIHITYLYVTLKQNKRELERDKKIK